MPPIRKDIYPVLITRTDDINREFSRHSFRLKPGLHTIKLHELISENYTGLKRSLKIRKSKTIEINVEPNITYHLGAKFIPANRYNNRNGKYWEPIIWKESKNECSL